MRRQAGTKHGAIPLWLKIAYTLFVAGLAPVYWMRFGPTHFLWGSDIALFAMLIAVWRESRLITSTVAVAVLLPELAWNLDFFTRLIAGRGLTGLDATAYMFNPAQPLWLRGLSLFHVFLPALLVWLLYRLGYDRRAWLAAGWCCPPLTCSRTRPGISIGYLDWAPRRRPGCPLPCI